jgi:hypothetical protein
MPLDPVTATAGVVLGNALVEVGKNLGERAAEVLGIQPQHQRKERFQIEQKLIDQLIHELDKRQRDELQRQRPEELQRRNHEEIDLGDDEREL